MSTVYSQLLIAISGVALNRNFVVPAGFIWVVRDITCAVTGGGLGDQQQLYDVTTGTMIARFVEVASDASQQWSGRQVCPPGTTLNVASNGTGLVLFRVSGYALTSP